MYKKQKKKQKRGARRRRQAQAARLSLEEGTVRTVRKKGNRERMKSSRENSIPHPYLKT
jgi:hypothetical protein